MEWIEVPGFPGYAVNAAGQVRGRRGWILQPEPIKGGYQRVGVRDGSNNQRHMLVHRLVLLAFVGPCPDGQEVNHQNGNTADNRLSNLEYTTPSQNTLHSFLVLGRTDNQGEDNSYARLTNQTILAMRAAHASGLSAAEVGRQFAVHPAHAWRICTHRSWRHLP